MSATQQNEQSIYQVQKAAELAESGKLRANSSVFVSSVGYVIRVVYRP